MRVRWGVARGFAGALGVVEGGSIFTAETKTGGNGTAAVTPTAAIKTVHRPANMQSATMACFDSVHRLTPVSRIEMTRFSSCDGCAIDTEAKPILRSERSPRTT